MRDFIDCWLDVARGALYVAVTMLVLGLLFLFCWWLTLKSIWIGVPVDIFVAITVISSIVYFD